jgi:metal-responsive CopG/Arc/MetJ family transcriptional regulator
MDYQSKKIRQVRLQVSLPATILAAVDEYRFATRAPNRAEAVRRLLKLGQAATSPPRPRSN